MPTMMKFNGMTVRTLSLLLFLKSYGDGDVEEQTPPTRYDHEDRNYCFICPDHTMCLFPVNIVYDRYSSPQYDRESADCIDMKNGILDEEDIETVLDTHNFYRVVIANGKESRGNPGPQPAAKTMMELIWDDELAVIARRWALQCKLFQKDQCRDVECFGVWQNVNVLYMDSVESGTSKERIHFHIASWYDEVEDFDNAKVGLVNYSASRQLSSYIPLASATFIYVGCGRAIYTLDLNKTATSYHRDAVTAPGGFGNRVEVFVCNYGPVDRTAPRQLYELGQPGLCPPGTFPSDRYQSLCKMTQGSLSPNKSSRRMQVRNRQPIRNRAFSTVWITPLSRLLSLLFLNVWLLLYGR